MARAFPGLKGMDLAKEVSTHRTLRMDAGRLVARTGLPAARADDALPLHVVAYDFGIKRNILRMLAERGCRVTVVPAQTPAAEVLATAARTAFFCPMGRAIRSPVIMPSRRSGSC